MKKNYIDDYKLTKTLLKEIKRINETEDFKDKHKHPQPPQEIVLSFFKIQKHILEMRNFIRYSEDIKEEFVSFSNLEFLKKWYKFKPERVLNNKNRTPDEYVGAFSYFSLILFTSFVQEIKKFKRQQRLKEEVKVFANAYLNEFVVSKRSEQRGAFLDIE